MKKSLAIFLAVLLALSAVALADDVLDPAKPAASEAVGSSDSSDGAAADIVPESGKEPDPEDDSEASRSEDAEKAETAGTGDVQKPADEAPAAPSDDGGRADAQNGEPHKEEGKASEAEAADSGSASGSDDAQKTGNDTSEEIADGNPSEPKGDSSQDIPALPADGGDPVDDETTQNDDSAESGSNAESLDGDAGSAENTDGETESAPDEASDSAETDNNETLEPDAAEQEDGDSPESDADSSEEPDDDGAAEQADAEPGIAPEEAPVSAETDDDETPDPNTAEQEGADSTEPDADASEEPAEHDGEAEQTDAESGSAPEEAPVSAETDDGETPDPDAAEQEDGAQDGDSTESVEEVPEEPGDDGEPEQMSNEPDDIAEDGLPEGSDSPGRGEETKTPEGTIGPGSPVGEILRVQGYLVALGYLGEGEKTGVYDDATRAAVSAFQADMNAAGVSLSVTGLCDTQTLSMLASRAAEESQGFGPDTSHEGEKPGDGKKPGKGGFPSGAKPGKRMGSFPQSAAGMAGAMSAGGQQADDGATNGVTPGKALTSSHAKGDRDDTPYGALAEDTIDTDELGIALRTGADAEHLTESECTVECSGDVLYLDAGDSAIAQWSFDGGALRTLSRSGIARLMLSGGGRTLALDTEGLLCGERYQALRAKGWTDNTFAFTVTLTDAAEELIASVDGADYLLAAAEEGYTLFGEV